ncbi:GNAT family N-acetyltransferase [Pseudomonas sp. BN102]|uniref:GNAT family N-acetyltransferase n=1 Tax=Pseudomonas sp. BN102 TaxID=2567886 RepID=UPI0024577F81|nr:GNAT family N-acetyltransferase [Pseudomonas sp. BN102]MDH4608711.1 GNAT family N-acetyltransferase [Pseudomonas sp. BN102]
MVTTLPALSTPRLLLEPLCLADAEAIQRVFPQWEVVRYLSCQVPWPYPEDGALSYLRDVALPAMAAGREWHWSIRPRSERGRLIGLINLREEPGNNRGFWLDPAWQGQGLASEAAEAVTRYWFEVLGRPLMRVPKAAANLASRRISERSGMRLVATDERDYVSGRLNTEVWELTREEWLAQQRPSTDR